MAEPDRRAIGRLTPAVGLCLLLTMVGTSGAHLAAGATPIDKNLIRNRGAERGGMGYPDQVVRSIVGWRRTGNFTVNGYGTDGMFPLEEGRRIRGGRSYFACGPLAKESRLMQRVRLIGRSKGVDQGLFKARLRLFVSAPASEGDSARVVLKFIARRNRLLASRATPWISGTPSAFRPRTLARAVPRRTQVIAVMLRGVRQQGLFCNAFFDNVDLRLLRR